MPPPNPEPIREYLAEIGRKGGQKKSPRKARSSEMASAASKTRWKKRPAAAPVDLSQTPRLDNLLDRVRTICEAFGQGALSELSAFLHRTPSQVSEYLSTAPRKIKRRPNAEITLALAEWVERKTSSDVK